MKKFKLLTASFISMGAAALFADAHHGYGVAENALAQSSGYGHDTQKTQSAQPAEQQGMPTRQITPEVEPKVTHWADPFITAEFIYWKAYEEGLQYASSGVAPARTSAGRGKVHAPDFDYEPGFKLGFGLRFNHDGWDLYANWTWLSEFEGSGDVDSSDDYVVSGSWITPVVAPQIGLNEFGLSMNEADVDSSMQFNALDLELGRNFYISRYLTLRPHFGFKFGWIDQDYKTKYEDLIFPGAVDADYEIKMDQDFFGCGLRTGLDTVWYFTKHWGLYGEFAFAALWSQFHSSRKDSYEDSGAGIAEYTTLHTRDHFNTITEVLELGLGFRYDTTFFVGDYAFYLQAGWEEQIWFNQNQFYDMADNVTGNMSMQGLSVKAGLMF